MSSPPVFPHYPGPKPHSYSALSRWWLAAAAVFATAGLVVASVVVAFIVRNADADAVSFIDDPDVLAVVEPECDQMTKTIDRLTVTGSPRQQANIITKQNAAVQRMVDAVRALDPELLAGDEPTLKWTDDWERLIAVRSDYADALTSGRFSELKEPKDPNGDSILDRMDWAGPPECAVPDALLDPYPEYIAGV